MTGIYKITNPDNEVYIGQSVTIDIRFNSHRISKYVSDKHFLNNSFKKHGRNNHIFEIIEECDILQLNERERYWQDFYNSTHKILNMNLTKTSTKRGCLTNDALKQLKITKFNKCSRYILDTQFGIFYNTISEASLSSIYSDCTTRKMLLGFRKNKTNLIFV